MKSFTLEQLAKHHDATGSIVHRYVTESDYQNLAAQYQFLRNAVIAHTSGTDRPFELLKALEMSPEQCPTKVQAEAEQVITECQLIVARATTTYRESPGMGFSSTIEDKTAKQLKQELTKDLAQYAERVKAGEK